MPNEYLCLIIMAYDGQNYENVLFLSSKLTTNIIPKKLLRELKLTQIVNAIISPSITTRVWVNQKIDTLELKRWWSTVIINQH